MRWGGQVLPPPLRPHISGVGSRAGSHRGDGAQLIMGSWSCPTAPSSPHLPVWGDTRAQQSRGRRTRAAAPGCPVGSDGAQRWAQRDALPRLERSHPPSIPRTQDCPPQHPPKPGTGPSAAPSLGWSCPPSIPQTWDCPIQHPPSPGLSPQRPPSVPQAGDGPISPTSTKAKTVPFSIP